MYICGNINNMTKQEIGKTLKEIRQANGISTYELEKIIPPKTIYAIELHETNVRIDTLMKYCDAVGAVIKIEKK